MMNPPRSSWLLAPVHAAALLSEMKSFRGNPILGRNVLNRPGLHVTAYPLPRQWPLSVGADSSIC
jgi:hypothetical protein